VRSLEATWLDVERRMRRGERFTEVEDAIDASDLEDDEKAGLWLLGWSHVHPRAQRREALAHPEDLLAIDSIADRGATVSEQVERR